MARDVLFSEDRTPYNYVCAGGELRFLSLLWRCFIFLLRRRITSVVAFFFFFFCPARSVALSGLSEEADR